MTPKLDFELRVNTRQKTSVQIQSTQLSANISQRVLTFSFFPHPPPLHLNYLHLTDGNDTLDNLYFLCIIVKNNRVFPALKCFWHIHFHATGEKFSCITLRAKVLRVSTDVSLFPELSISLATSE